MSTFFHFNRRFRPKNKVQAAPNEKPHKAFRRDIQALRAFAVVSVVLYHLWPDRLIGGFTGVDIFFVISGYLMTTSIMRRLTPLAEKHEIKPRSVGRLLAEFYARRIKRLVPAALAALIGTLALAALSGNLNVLLTNAKNAVSAATFWQNWFLANDSLNYLQQDNLVVATQHFWSLSLEEQFYAMWPLLLVVSTLVTINIVVFFKKQKIAGAILPIVLATLLSLAYGIWLTKHSPTVAYYDTFGRVWELMVGGIIAFLPVIKNYDLKLLMPYAGLVINLYSIFFISGDGFPGWSALLPTVGTAMIIWAGVGHAESRLAFDKIFSWRPIQWTGDVSYSIYLWHFPLIILLPIIVHRDLDGSHGRLFKITIIILSFIVAWLSYIYIEQSTQKLRLKTRYIYLLFAIATSLVVGLSLGIQHHTENQIQTNLKAMHAAALDENDACFGARALMHRDKCGNPYGVTNPAYMSVGRNDYWLRPIQEDGKTCDRSNSDPGAKSNTRAVCVLGDTNAQRSIILVGDSHAEQYLNTFDTIGKERGYRVYLLSTIYCFTDWAKTKDNALCKDRYAYILSFIRSHPKSLVVASLLFVGYTDVEEFITPIKSSATDKVVLLNDEPRSTVKKLNECYTLRVNCVIPRSVATKHMQPIADALINNGILSRSSLINLDDFYCDKLDCYSSIGGVPVYYNTVTVYGQYNSHINPSFSFLWLLCLSKDSLARAI